MLVGLALGLVGCESRQTITAPAGADTRSLFDLNAHANDGRTVRWATLPIPVFTNGIAREDEVTAWSRATGGAVSFVFVNSPPARGIRFRPGGGNDLCGLATVEFDDDRIISVDIQIAVAIYRSTLCIGPVIHEIGHAIGFLAHTADGGLMDPDGGDGRITSGAASFIRSLYSLPPGTFVGVSESLRTKLGRSGRRTVTIVDPVRR